MTDPAPDPATGVADGASYEEIVSALEGVTARMASDDIGIEEATDLYERAARLHALATERLAGIQARIDALKADGG